MYGKQAEFLFNKLQEEGLIGAKGKITLSLLGTTVDINDKSGVGNLLQEWLGKWMTEKKIYHRSNTNSQMPPDFYLSESEEKDLLEIKTFDYVESPNFDVANFDAYTRDLREKAYRLDADYLIMGYTLTNGVIEVNKIWLKKVWEITCPSNEYALRIQQKQGVIYNIRPYNLKSVTKGFQPFNDRLHFVNAVKETIAKYRKSEEMAQEWLESVKESYSNFNETAL